MGGLSRISVAGKRHGLGRGIATGRRGWAFPIPGLRELKGAYPVAQICSSGHIDRVCTLDGTDLTPETLIDVGERVRPVLRGGQATLFVEEQNQEWDLHSKERIKSLSN